MEVPLVHFKKSVFILIFEQFYFQNSISGDFSYKGPQNAKKLIALDSSVPYQGHIIRYFKCIYPYGLFGSSNEIPTVLLETQEMMQIHA